MSDRPALRIGLPIAAALAGCTEYGLGKDVDPAIGDSGDTAVGDTTGDTTLGEADTGTVTDGCYAPEFGYDSSPAARLVATDAAPVTVTMVLSDTAYQNSLTLDQPELLALMDAWTSPVGTAVGIGPYPAGTELVFGIDVQDTGDHWQSGPASRNGDGVAHVAVTYEGSCAWRIGFEDLYGGGDLDYNDVVFRVEGRLVEQ